MKGRNLVIPQRTGSDLPKPSCWSAEDPASLALLPSPQKAMCPHSSSGCLARGAPDAWCPRPPLQLFCDSAVSPPPFPYSFLSLAGNRIRQVENLRDLPHLQFLDLSENLIEILKLGRNALALAHGITPGGALPPCACLSAHPLGSGGLCKEAVALDRKVGVRTSLFLSLLCADEFPESLLILNLTGNSCTNQDGYR